MQNYLPGNGPARFACERSTLLRLQRRLSKEHRAWETAENDLFGEKVAEKELFNLGLALTKAAAAAFS